MPKYYSEKKNDLYNKKWSNNTDPCYYLLYKLIVHPTLWIIKVDDNKKLLLDHIKGFQSDIEQYYIVKKNVKNLENELKTKHFTIFKPDSEYMIIDVSDRLKY